MTQIIRIAAVLALCLTFFAAAPAYSADSRTVLLVQVYPEVVLQREGVDSVVLKVRLPTGTEGRMWADLSCGAPRPNAYVVSRSGLQIVSLAGLQAGPEQSICFASSDQRLTAALPPVQARVAPPVAAEPASGK